MLGLGETLDLRRGLLRAVISLRSLEDYYRPIVFSVAGQTTPCDALHASWLLPFPLSRPLRRSVAQLGALWLRVCTRYSFGIGNIPRIHSDLRRSRLPACKEHLCLLRRLYVVEHALCPAAALVRPFVRRIVLLDRRGGQPQPPRPDHFVRGAHGAQDGYGRLAWAVARHRALPCRP